MPRLRVLVTSFSLRCSGLISHYLLGDLSWTKWHLLLPVLRFSHAEILPTCHNISIFKVIINIGTNKQRQEIFKNRRPLKTKSTLIASLKFQKTDFSMLTVRLRGLNMWRLVPSAGCGDYDMTSVTEGLLLASFRSSVSSANTEKSYYIILYYIILYYIILYYIILYYIKNTGNK